MPCAAAIDDRQFAQARVRTSRSNSCRTSLRSPPHAEQVQGSRAPRSMVDMLRQNAPIPPRANGTTAPTAGYLLATATAQTPESGSTATIENVRLVA